MLAKRRRFLYHNRQTPTVYYIVRSTAHEKSSDPVQRGERRKSRADRRCGALWIAQGLCNIPNLQSVVRSLGAYEVVVLYHKQIGEVGRLAPDAVLLSGIFTDRALPYDTVLREYEGVISWLRTADVPTFGICLGLQLICAAFGVGIRRLPREGEFGFKPLYRQTAHPLLEGVAEPLHCLELHRCEIDHVPEGFSLLLSSDLCRGQMIAHASRPLFGTQFHPELTDGYHRDGIQLLENFLRLY